MTTSPFSAKYRERLATIPTPGGGGCHVSLLGAANLGILAGLDPKTIHANLRAAIPHGPRRVTDREIADAINKALQDHNGGSFTPRQRPKPIVQDGQATFRRIIDSATITTEVDLWETSPIRLWEAP